MTPARPPPVHPVDRLIESFDQALRTLLGGNSATRPYPAEGIAETVEPARRTPACRRPQRVNHSGEVAAQALYQGQAAVAASSSTQAALLEAAREETDHLAWCATRIEELGGRPACSIRCGTRARSRSARSRDWAATAPVSASSPRRSGKSSSISKDICIDCRKRMRARAQSCNR